MKKCIRFFRNKEDTIPQKSFQILPLDKQTNNNTVVEDSETLFSYIQVWMEVYDNGKVDFVWLNT